MAPSPHRQERLGIRRIDDHFDLGNIETHRRAERVSRGGLSTWKRQLIFQFPPPMPPPVGPDVGSVSRWDFPNQGSDQANRQAAPVSRIDCPSSKEVGPASPRPGGRAKFQDMPPGPSSERSRHSTHCRLLTGHLPGRVLWDALSCGNVDRGCILVVIP